MTTTDASTSTRWVGVGNSNNPDARKAGAEAAEAALRGASDPKLIVVFASNSYDLPALLASIDSTTGGAPMVGCSTAGEISKSGIARSSVVVTVFGGAGFAATTKASPLAVGGRAAGMAIASAGAGSAGENRLFLMFIDGLAPNHEEVVRAVYTVLGEKVPLVGGAAGDDDRARATAQFHDGKVLTDSVVGALIDSDGAFGIGVRHGWQQVGEPMSITKSVSGRVFTLDGEPALDAYLKRLDAPAAAYTDPEAFRNFASTRPLSIKRRTGGEIRGVVEKADHDKRSLYCAGELPQGSQAWAMEGDAGSVLGATKEACDEALEGLAGKPAIGMIAFDCHGRFQHLGSEGVRSEQSTILQSAGGAPLSGFYTYGEIARTRGMHGYHHMTLVMLAIA